MSRRSAAYRRTGRPPGVPRSLPDPGTTRLPSGLALRGLYAGRSWRPGLPATVWSRWEQIGDSTMNLLRLLLRSSKWTVLLACAVGFAGGAGSVGLLALIHAALNGKEASPGLLIWGGVVLCLAVLLTRVISQSLLIRLA